MYYMLWEHRGGREIRAEFGVKYRCFFTHLAVRWIFLEHFADWIQKLREDKGLARVMWGLTGLQPPCPLLYPPCPTVGPR